MKYDAKGNLLLIHSKQQKVESEDCDPICLQDESAKADLMCPRSKSSSPNRCRLVCCKYRSLELECDADH